MNIIDLCSSSEDEQPVLFAKPTFASISSQGPTAEQQPQQPQAAQPAPPQAHAGEAGGAKGATGGLGGEGGAVPVRAGASLCSQEAPLERSAGSEKCVGAFLEDQDWVASLGRLVASPVSSGCSSPVCSQPSSQAEQGLRVQLARPPLPPLLGPSVRDGSQQAHGCGLAAAPLPAAPLPAAVVGRGGLGGGAGAEAGAGKQAAKTAAQEARLLAKEEAARAKLMEQEAKVRAREDAKAAKLAAKAAEKASKQEAKAVQKALSGRDTKKHMLLRMSPRMLEAAWVADLLAVLNNEGYEYKVDASLPLGADYALIRWARRVPASAAAALIPTSQGAPPPCPAPTPDGSGLAEVLFPCVMLFLPASDLVAGLLPGGGGLHALRAAVSAALPDCTLHVGVLDLERHLTQRERAPGSPADLLALVAAELLAEMSACLQIFHRGTVLDALMDLQLLHPAIRLREDLKDGPQAAEYVATFTRCLVEHHKRQQEGYLAAFHENRLSNSHPELQGMGPQACTLAHALTHLVPADKAVKVAKAHGSLAALLQAFSNTSLSKRDKENLVMNSVAHIQGKGTIGAKASKDLFEYFTADDPDKDISEA
ncbi:hypothetical protein QJQ45_017663 [Haematococcus lacustris]|nr:hypothetical protein QJQ45_017663 [Haematococcus lacustris]